MRIISYNVNGIRAAIKKGFFEWLKTDPADVICLQEIKATREDVDIKLLEALGFEQVPTFSNWEDQENVYSTVRFCKANISPERLKGFLHAPWRPTLEEVRPRHMAALEEITKAREVFAS